jgi:ribokinase
MVINFGSLNVDHVYRVAHFVRPGETLASQSYNRFPGGKGFNQSVALARAGVPVRHAGKIGADGLWLQSYLADCGADTAGIETTDGPTGHAIIQVTPQGENAIVLHGGANRRITPADAERTLATAGPGDLLLLQNEISALPEIMQTAAARGLSIAFNPAPMDASVLDLPLDLVGTFILNEVEAGMLAGVADESAMLAAMRRRFPNAAVVLTLGSKGARYADARETLAAPAVPVKAVDTTAAGDTFIGYFLAERILGRDAGTALATACRAAAICVTRPGAAVSIPTRAEVSSLESKTPASSPGR